MKVFEEHHNTAEQVESYLAGALAVVSELEVDDELRAIAFTKAVDLLSSKTVQVAPDSSVVLGQQLGGRLHG